MKTKLTIALILALVFGYGCKSGTEKSPPIYHIRVECELARYRIVFTNDNWITNHEIMETFDISEVMGGSGEWVRHQTWLDTEKNSISLAKTLNTYQKCLDYNAKVKQRYIKLLEYRRSHPVKEKADLEVKKECNPTEIY